MPKKQRKFADDGWAIWIDGDDTSTVYINDWLNPKGNNYIDIAVRIRGIKVSKGLHVYVPFEVSRNEIEDVSLLFNDTKILQATFSAACIVDYKKNSAVVGIVGKIRDSIENFLLDEVRMEALTLSTLSLELGTGYSEGADYTYLWRLEEYRNSVKQGEQVEKWDELEKSVIASVADDVIVGVKKKQANIIIVKKFT